MQPVIQVANVSIVFHQGRRRIEAIRDISFSVSDAEFVALLGPSGCGKSTLLNTISGLVPPTAGSVEVMGEPVRKPGNRHIAYMFQSDVLVPWKTAWQNVALPLQISGEKQRLAQVDDFLAQVGLEGFANAYPSQLSGGMRQRVQLARTLIQEPQILLMDEPFGALDAQTRRQLQSDFLRICSHRDMTVVLVTHDIQEAIFMADRVLVLMQRPGRIDCSVNVPIARPRELREVVAHEAYDEIFVTILSALEGRGQDFTRGGPHDIRS